MTINRTFDENTMVWNIPTEECDIMLFVQRDTRKLMAVRRFNSDGSYVDYDLDCIIDWGRQSDVGGGAR
jgi:hypothetical protein